MASEDQPSAPDSSTDRWAHEIEELERPMGRESKMQWVVATAIAGGLVAVFLLLASLD